MILKGSERSGARKLGHHLMNANDNEHIEVHQVKGFMARDVLGAMNEATVISLGTKCQKYLFSLSLDPPPGENPRLEIFESAISRIEDKLGLTGQPRIVVFHEKEGRRHCHVVWSRIDAETMTAKRVGLYKLKLNELSKTLFIENGWKLPGGYLEGGKASPLNFTLAEWQQAKRAQLDPAKLKETVKACYAASSNREQLREHLEKSGLFLAKGDRRGYVVLTARGEEVFALTRLVDQRTKDVTQKLGPPPENFRSVQTAREDISKLMSPVLKDYIADARAIAANQLRPLHAKRLAMRDHHREERRKLDTAQKERHAAETKARADRLPKGLAGLWHRLTGQYGKIRKQNEFEAHFSMQRDRTQRDELVQAQLVERQQLQTSIVVVRARHHHQIDELIKDAAVYQGEGKQQAVAATKTQGRDISRERGLGLG